MSAVTPAFETLSSSPSTQPTILDLSSPTHDWLDAIIAGIVGQYAGAYLDADKAATAQNLSPDHRATLIATALDKVEQENRPTPPRQKPALA